MEHYTRFADPLVDWTFKRIFGTEQYKDATIGLLNSLITDRQVRDVSFLNVEVPGLTGEDRKSYIDVLCRGDDGSTFIVEMQIAKHTHFRERTVLYASTVISHRADRGDTYDFELKPTYAEEIQEKARRTWQHSGKIPIFAQRPKGTGRHPRRLWGKQGVRRLLSGCRDRQLH